MARRTAIRFGDLFREYRFAWGLALCFLGAAVGLGWPPDFARRWWVLIPLAVAGLMVMVGYGLARRHEGRTTSEPIQPVSFDDPDKE